MDDAFEKVREIAANLSIPLIETDEIKGLGFYSADVNMIFYNSRLGPITKRMIILHELGHALSYKRIDKTTKNDILSTIRHEYAANRFMIRFEVENYINEVGIDNFVIEHFMEKYDFPEDFKPFVKRVIKQALKMK